MSQQRAHRVHLSVRGRRVPTGRVDLLDDESGLRDAEPSTAVFGRDERPEPAGVGERAYEPLGVFARAVQLAPVVAGELRAERTHRRADRLLLVGPSEVHRYSRGSGKCDFSAFARVGIMKVRFAIRTIVPSCLMPRWRTVTMPHPGRDRDARASRTSVSA